MSAAGVWGLWFDERLAVENAIAVKQPSPCLDEFFKAQIKGAVEIAQICALQALERLDWIAHASLSPVMASVSLRISSGTSANEIRRVAAS